MKIRTYFVSNSSSCSFIVAIKEGDFHCPTCGRSNINLIEAIEHSNWEDTEITHYNKKSILKDINNRLRELNQDLTKYSQHADDYITYQGGSTVKMEKRWINEEVSVLTNRRDKIINTISETPQIISFNVGRSDNTIHEIIEQMVNNKSLIIIEKEEN